MTDKEKFRAEIERLKESGCASPIVICDTLLAFIDSMQEEPVSDDFEKALAKEWQEYNDRGAATVDALEDNTQELAFAKGFYRAWHYRKEEPISEKSENGDFTKELAECIHQAQCSVVDPLAHAEVWKEELVKLVKCEEPVSEDLKAEIVRYIGYSQEVNKDVSTTKIRKAAHHFAEWQKKQMIDKFNEWCQEEFYIHPHDCNVVQYVSDKQLESIDDFIEEFKEKMEDKQ